MTGTIPKGVPSRANEIIATAICFSVLSIVFVSLRMYTRLRIIRTTGWDDYAAMITLPFCIAFGVLLCIATRYGLGLHSSDLPVSLLDLIQAWTIGIGSTYVLSLLGYKMAILLLYSRVFNVDKVFRYCTWTVMFVTFGYLFSNFWTQIFGCQPIAKDWRPWIPGHCISTWRVSYVYGALNFITDLLIFILPLPMVWRMQLSLREKVGVSGIFMIGSVNWAVAIVRFIRMVLIFKSNDQAWLAAETLLWAIIEVNTGLILACVPVLRPFIRVVNEANGFQIFWPKSRERPNLRSRTIRDDSEFSEGKYLRLKHRNEIDLIISSSAQSA